MTPESKINALNVLMDLLVEDIMQNVYRTPRLKNIQEELKRLRQDLGEEYDITGW